MYAYLYMYMCTVFHYNTNEFIVILCYRNGRDVHRELCGFFFLSDSSLTIYEFRQFGQRYCTICTLLVHYSLLLLLSLSLFLSSLRVSALPLLPRGVYRFPKGKREGEQYNITHIRKVSSLLN